MATVVLRFENQFSEMLDAEIFDANRLKDARAKAYRYLRKTYCSVVSKTRNDNYEYWTAVDVADMAAWQRNNKSEPLLANYSFCGTGRR